MLPISVIILTESVLEDNPAEGNVPDTTQLSETQQSVQWATEIITYPVEEPITDFSQIRNQALKKAHQEWVLFLDSDEVFDADSLPQLTQIIRSNCDGIYLQRKDVFYGKTLNYGEAGMTQLLRLGRRTKMQFIRPVHEIAVIDGKICTSQIKIFHYSHSSLSEFIQKNARYAQLEAAYRQQSKNTFPLLQMIIYPPAKFVYNYIVKAGFLDGWQGFSYAIMMSLHSFWVRSFQYQDLNDN